MAFAIQNLVWGIGCIFFGMLADRYGAGRTIVLGAVLGTLGLIGMRLSTDELSLYMTAGVLVGLGQARPTFPVILPVVARAVPAATLRTPLVTTRPGGSPG